MRNLLGSLLLAVALLATTFGLPEGFQILAVARADPGSINLRAALETANRQRAFPAGPAPRFDGIVQVSWPNEGSSSARATYQRLVKAAQPVSAYVFESTGGDANRASLHYDLIGLGGLAWVGYADSSTWELDPFETMGGRLFPMEAGQRAWFTRRGWSFEFVVEGRAGPVAGFEWLDGDLHVVREVAKVAGGGYARWHLFSSRLGVAVYSASESPSGQAVVRVVGASLGERRIGASLAEAAANPVAYVSEIPRPVAWAESGHRPVDHAHAIEPEGDLPRTGLALRDGTAECECSRTLGRCSAPASIRDEQVSRLSNGRSSLVVVGVEPPAGKCVEVTVRLEEQALIGGRPRRTGHPLFRVIDAPTDIEWRNVSTPATELDYRVLDGETECFVCRRRGSAVAEAEATKPARKTSGPYFHAAIFQPAAGSAAGALVYVGLSGKSPEAARRSACTWPNSAGFVSNQACQQEILGETLSDAARVMPNIPAYSQKILKCSGGGYFAVALSSGMVGVSCGAAQREAAERSALEACRSAWAGRGLPDGGGQDSGLPHSPATCHVAWSALNDGSFARTEDFPGYLEDGAGGVVQCWGRDRRYFNPHLDDGCKEIAAYCLRNPGECR